MSNSPPTVRQRVLVVEDVEDTRETLKEHIELCVGVEVDTAENGQVGLVKLKQRPYSLVLTNLRMPKMTGMKLLEAIRAEKIPVTAIVITGHGDVKEAVEAMRLGAYDFLQKGCDPQILPLIVKRALRDRLVRDEVAALREQLGERHSFRNVLSKSAKMHDIFGLISDVADTTAAVLVSGETGTGKEAIARALHDASAVHRPGEFVVVNCAALRPSSAASELFGQEKGAFAGAVKRTGRFASADKGTLFLDEVGDLPLELQAVVARALQDLRVEPVGGTTPTELDLRVVAATGRDIDGMVENGAFRKDLYYSLNTVRFDIPPLRERREDIPILATHFCQKYARPSSKPPEVSDEAMRLLSSFAWPGNVRQLEGVIQRGCSLAREGLIESRHLPPSLRGVS